MYNIVFSISTSGIPCKLDNIFNEYKVYQLERKNIYCHEKYVSRIQKLVGIEIKQIPMKIRLCWQRIYQVAKNGLSLKELNLRFLDDFDYYLDRESIKQITINKIIQT
jgi:hypothetical protein